jgi:hypothetical protein
MLGVLALAFVLDRILRAQINPDPQLLEINTTVVWLAPLFQLLTMIAALGLIWMMIASGGYSRWVSVIFLVVGLVILYITAIMAVVRFPDPMYILVEYLAVNSYLFQAGGAIAAMGLLSLWFWKEEAEPLAGDEEEGLAASDEAMDGKGKPTAEEGD